MSSKFKKSLILAGAAGTMAVASPIISTDGFNITIGVEHAAAAELEEAVAAATSTSAATSDSSDSGAEGSGPGDGPGSY